MWLTAVLLDKLTVFLTSLTAFLVSLTCEEERQQIKLLIRHGFMPHHSAVGKGRCTRRHWNMEKYRGKHGVGFKLITASSISSNFNHITYFLKLV